MEAISLAKQHLPDLVLLDLMIPGVDGFEVYGDFRIGPWNAPPRRRQPSFLQEKPDIAENGRSV